MQSGALDSISKAAAASPISKLCPDLLACIFSLVSTTDPCALTCARRVCAAWSSVATREELWLAAVHARWKLRTHRPFGKYKYGERSWIDVYRAFHCVNRLPSLPMISTREARRREMK